MDGRSKSKINPHPEKESKTYTKDFSRHVETSGYHTPAPAELCLGRQPAWQNIPPTHPGCISRVFRPRPHHLRRSHARQLSPGAGRRAIRADLVHALVQG